MRSRRITI
uniref:Uncharacterized protein n=1 Tax=Arundo donax TaxID=35708 RepID=A0A0A9ENI1_ARUDO